MDITIENQGTIQADSSPDMFQLKDTSMQIFSSTNQGLFITQTDPTNGVFDGFILGDNIKISEDSDIQNFSIDELDGFGGIGCFQTGNAQKLIVCEFEEYEKKLEYLKNKQW